LNKTLKQLINSWKDPASAPLCVERLTELGSREWILTMSLVAKWELKGRIKMEAFPE